MYDRPIDSGVRTYRSPSTSVQQHRRRSFSYEEAIELAGNGRYNSGLLAAMSLCLLGMALDVFGFPVIVTLASCELGLDHIKKSLLVSVPFIGPILMAFPWGFVSDTRGRRRSLLVAMAVSFFCSVICVFATHWAIMALLRLISTCFCSCAQSVTYTLLGESTSSKFRGFYLLILTSVFQLNSPIYYSISFFITNMDFSYYAGGITFTPWRLLVFVLALPLGLSALCLVFFFESPKFLINADREDEALDVLSRIYRRNGGDDEYPVTKLSDDEVDEDRSKHATLLQSMWNQTAPLFQASLRPKTFSLFYLTFVIFSSSSSIYVWLPFLAESLSAGVTSWPREDQGLCAMVVTTRSVNVTAESLEDGGDFITCTSGIDSPIVIAAVAEGLLTCILNGLISKMASRRRLLLIIIFMASALSAVGAVLIPNNVVSIILFFGILMNNLGIGLLFLYWVDLFPTSYRGMASCLGVLVSRASSLVGVNLVGPFILSHCAFTFGIGFSMLMFSGAVVSYFLPHDSLPH